MSRFQLSRAAADDLHEIRRFTHEQFGLKQAIKIREQFRKIFETLAHAPRSAPRREEYDPEGKSFRYFPALKRFIIVYEPSDRGIRVARILHGARDLARELELEAGKQ